VRGLVGVGPRSSRRLASPMLLLLACAIVAGLSSPATAAGQERILRYDSEVDIRADGTLEVTEHITVRAEGTNIRRGIFRDFPTRYRDRYGNRVRVDFEMISVHRNGQPEEWFTERRANGIRINTGGDAFLPVPAEYTFTLRYRTTRQLGFFEEHDELYWNAIGTGWAFPIEAGAVEVRLPGPVPVADLHAEGYTGPQGARGTAYEAWIPEPGTSRYRLTAGLAPREGLTIVLTFPKGIVEEPSGARRAGWFLSDNRGVFVALMGLIVLLWYCVTRWQEVGRDPRPGVIIPRYRPPDGHGPAGLRYLRRKGTYDTRCFSGDLLALAVTGRLGIGNRKRFLREEWWVEGPPTPPGDGFGDASGDGGGLHRVTASQEALLRKLLPGGKGRLEFKKSNASKVQAAFSTHRKLLDKEFHPRFFKRNTGHAASAGFIGVAAIILAFATSGGNAIAAILVLSAVMVLTVMIFGFLIPAPTQEGRRLLDEIEGLRLYLSVAERDELAGMTGPDGPPQLDAERYEALLPFAVALEVEDAWTKKFTAAVGAAAAAEAARRMTWYSGSAPITDVGGFTRAMGSTLTSQISSSSSPPGSSSGSGGGGSSGGGGGGGGGGGR
jgi:uncharacterized membrane protein YgcG